MRHSEKWFWGMVMAAAVALLLACTSACSTLDRAYKQEVTWTNAPVVHVFTNTVVVTNTVPVVTERTNVVFVTNAASGSVTGIGTREAVATNYSAVTVTNIIPVFMTNM